MEHSFLRTSLLSAVLLAWACGCSVVPPAGADLSGDPLPLGAGRASAGAFEPALHALALAIEAHDDELAGRILQGVWLRQPEGSALELAQGYQRILDGRALMQSLDFKLEIRPDEREAGDRRERRVVLCLRNSLDEALGLRLGPALLTRLVSSIDERGDQGLSSQTRFSDALTGLDLEPGEQRDLELLRYSTSIGRALAVRETFKLELRSGEIERGGSAYPAARPAALSCTEVRLAPFLPTTAVAASELAEYAKLERMSLPALIERSVRIRPEHYGTALDLLAAGVDELSLQRCGELSPALRWLTRDSELGDDARAWRAWLARRRGRGAESGDALEMPRLATGTPASGLELQAGRP